MSLIACNVPELRLTARSSKGRAAETTETRFQLQDLVLEWGTDTRLSNSSIDPKSVQRLGQYSNTSSNPRPIGLSFASEDHRHSMLRKSKDFRKAGIKFDDDHPAAAARKALGTISTG